MPQLAFNRRTLVKGAAAARPTLARTPPATIASSFTWIVCLDVIAFETTLFADFVGTRAKCGGQGSEGC